MGLSKPAEEIRRSLLERSPIAPLTPTEPWDAAVHRKLETLGDTDLFAVPVKNADYERATLSGLHLLNDSLDHAHRLAMSSGVSARNTRSTLDYWHGIMHRREPDYSNSKYWFHRVGDHPIFADVLDGAKEAVDDAVPTDDPVRATIERLDEWDPFRFIDLCAADGQDRGDGHALLRAIQLSEISRLLAFCIDQATRDV